MKKLVSLLLCLGVTCAQADHQAHHTFTGFYLTGAVGATQADFASMANLGTANYNFFPGHYDIYATSAAGLVGLSYLHQFGSRIVLGGQVTAGYANAQGGYLNEVIGSHTDPFDSALISSDLDVEFTNDFALLFKPGIVCGKDTLFYALIGPRWGNFETSLTTEVLLISDTQASAMGSDSESGYELGLTAGLGIQHMLTTHFQIGLEYAYTNYDEIDSPSVNAAVVPHQSSGQNSVPDTREIDVNTNTILLTLSYQW